MMDDVSIDYSRGWTFADEPCPYPGGCDLPLRTHMHYSHGPSDPWRVVFYDEEPLAARPSSTTGDDRG